MSRPAHQIKKPDVVTYAAAYTVTKLHLSTVKPQPFAQLRGIMGPLGSGKSVGCCWEIMQQACRMPPDEHGVRRSRWAVIRNTYRELEDTTLATWFDWFPEEHFGPFLRRGMVHEIRRTLEDGTRVELDVMFRALDKPKDVRKLLSLELTGAWINEAREIPRAVVDMLRKRVGRFPKWGSTAMYWHGIIMDTNPCEEDHWYYRFAENTDWSQDKSLLKELTRRGYTCSVEDLVASFKFYRQPSGRSPNAENLDNLPPGYYSTVGLRPDWIKVYIDGEYGYVQTGRPVYPEFYEQLHYVPELEPIGSVITIGMDFGLTPAAAFVQQDARGRYLCIDELVTHDLTLPDDEQDATFAMGATQFAEQLAAKIAKDYPHHTFRFVGDPSGDERSQTDANQTVFNVLRANGIFATPAVTQDWIRRRDAIGNPLNTLVDGRPQLMIGGKCRMIRAGLAGKYNYKRVQIAGDERFHDKPDKNDYSHPVEALQYAMLGAGSDPIHRRGRVARQHQAPMQADTNFNPWESRQCPISQPPAPLLKTWAHVYRNPGCRRYTRSSARTCARRRAVLSIRWRAGAA